MLGIAFTFPLLFVVYAAHGRIVKPKKSKPLGYFNSSKFEQNRKKIDYKEITKNQLSFNVNQCVCCKKGRMITVMQFMPNAPPKQINDRRKKRINNTL